MKNRVPTLGGSAFFLMPWRSVGARFLTFATPLVRGRQLGQMQLTTIDA